MLPRLALPHVCLSLLQCCLTACCRLHLEVIPLRVLYLRLLVSSLVIALAGVAAAGQKVDIYRADTLVKSQSEGERNAAARAAFGEVIVRVSGQRSAMNNPTIKAALPKAQHYLFGFSYKSSSEKIKVDGKTFPAIGLQLNYESRAIEQLLREAQLPVWPATRPKILVWLVANDGSDLRLVPEAADLQAMQSQAHYRGLLLAFPKLDLEDSLSLTVNDLWTLDIEKIKTASLRYRADAILIGRYTPSALGPITTVVGGNSSNVSPVATGESIGTTSALTHQGPWLGDWQLIHTSNQQSFTDETPEVKGLFVSVIDQAADYFANQYAIMPSSQGPQTIVLRINNIASFGEFKRAQAYLNELAMVQRMEVVTVNAESMLIRLTTEGDAKLLMSTLALGRRLAPLQSDTLIDTPVNGVVVDQAPAIGDDTGFDADMMAELDQALANEQNPGVISAAPSHGSMPVSGTTENPLLYVWQK